VPPLACGESASDRVIANGSGRRYRGACSADARRDHGSPRRDRGPAHRRRRRAAIPGLGAGAPLRVEFDGEHIAGVRTLRTGTRLRAVAAEREPNGDRRGD